MGTTCTFTTQYYILHTTPSPPHNTSITTQHQNTRPHKLRTNEAKTSQDAEIKIDHLTKFNQEAKNVIQKLVYQNLKEVEVIKKYI